VIIRKNKDVESKVSIEAEQFTRLEYFELLFPTYDGSMTRLMEICFQTEIRVCLLEQKEAPLPEELARPLPGWHHGAPTIKRVVLLQHASTRENLLFAISYLLLSHAPARLYQAMQAQTLLPLGKTLQQIPLLRHILQAEKVPATNEWRTYFSLPASAHCLSRHTMLHFEQGPAMLLQEVIPYHTESHRKKDD
jgi:chorismate-pyruvate lyase